MPVYLVSEASEIHLVSAVVIADVAVPLLLGQTRVEDAALMRYATKASLKTPSLAAPLAAF